MQSATHSFARRDNMGYAIPPSLIVLLIMLGAMAVVICGYAVSRLLGFSEAPNGYKPRSTEQEEYMREVRQRGLAGFHWEVQRGGRS
ncbi:uncharacterized protein BDR25DRAFT_306150 [Lindgomyces ingoldianus]|uniref:Uncharacterized protein n=1 Tax=Lindgomyces ingoldianus TaxID=673940 RepID=A0ACB6QH51_9PLEO|nr:uncharacterized protein BDR25DRAFT_306150 [Lindgomyces ingoldianus]KAF2466318.1 hypothetical protein BDR25DRAFT_306150 [Lindgomyces ingoldianus]